MTRGRKKRVPPGERSRDLPDRQAQEIERLKQENERLRKELIEREKKIADLERQLALRQQNSTTTSKPPSSDGLAGEQPVRGRRVKESAEGRRSAWPSRAPSCARPHRTRGYDRRSGARHVSPVCASLVPAAQRWGRAASSSHGVASDCGAHHGGP